MRDRAPVITVFEHQLLSVGDAPGGVPFSESRWQTLVQLHASLPRPYYTLTHRGVKLSHYVGVLKTPHFTLEILPKADQHPVPQVWRQLLIELIASCSSLPVDYPATPVPSFRAGALLEVYLIDFLTRVEQLCRQGLLRQYQPVTENSPALRGRIRFAEHVQRNAVHQERFWVEHTVHSRDHPLHQLIKRALILSREVSPTPAVQQYTRRLLHHFSCVSDKSVAQLTARKVVFHRYSERYRAAVTAAQQLLAASFSHVYRGTTHQGLALLLDMNLLFEEFVYRRLEQLSSRQDFNVRRQTTQSLWGATKARPDILIAFPDGRKNVVIDTKWKVLTQPRPSAEDLHQIYVYNQLFDAQRGILLYPRVNNLPQQQHRFGGPVTSYAEVHFIDIADPQRIRINPQLDDFLLQLLKPATG